MEDLLESLQFTNGADRTMVLELYTKTATTVLGGLEHIDFSGLALASGDDWCSPAQLAAALNLCSAVQVVKVNGMTLNDEGMAELVEGLADSALPALKQLKFHGNHIGAQGVTDLCDAFGRGVAPQLEYVTLTCNLFGDDGAKAFAAAIRAGRMPERLGTIVLTFCDIGDEGAKALAAALLESGSGCRLLLAMNRIGVSGVSALQALEAKHNSLLAVVAVSLNAPVMLPAFLMRTLSRGMRQNFEVKGKLL
jgi:hypothetical protein